MPIISWNEIRTRTAAFAKEFEDASSEKSDKQVYWYKFFEIFGVPLRKVGSFEENTKDLGGPRGWADYFQKGLLIIEHKSLGENLEAAAQQARDYLVGIKDRDFPRYLIVSDFQNIWLYDYEENDAQKRTFSCALQDLPKHIKKFGFIAGYKEEAYRDEDPVNKKAVQAVAKLHDALKDSNYGGHELEVLLTRLVFCFFADDTQIFEPNWFRDYIEKRTSEDGADLGAHLGHIFQTLNRSEDKRQTNLDEDLAALPYVDGHLFAENISLPSFDSKMREILLDCVSYDWSTVSPAIFGSMFQSVKDKKARRALGEHYTSEKNILKVIKPLFLDALWEEFERVKGQPKKVVEFHEKLGRIKLLDPACGCGNFLVVSYRELRLLELEAIKVIHGPSRQQAMLNVGSFSKIDVDAMYGIEIEEFPARIAELAMWLTDHQLNVRLGAEFGEYYARVPLVKSPHIHQINALTADWEQIVPKTGLSYIISNPPFVGSKYMTEEQRAEILGLFPGNKRAGTLDYVSGWYMKAATYMQGTQIKTAFVSTNSIVQGEQVATLWKPLLADYGVKIHFAHQTFAWTNEARGKAAVFVIVIGFAPFDTDKKTLFIYDDVRSEPHAVSAKNINPYLVDADDVVVDSRSNPLCAVPPIRIGNKPVDDGNYLFTTEEKEAFLRAEPGAAKFFRRWIGSDEFLHGYNRWCLWLGDATPQEIQSMPEVLKRVEAVRAWRLGRDSKPTKKLAEKPTRFHVETMPTESYLVIPKVSVGRRKYVPLGYEEPTTLASDLLHVVLGASSYHFGILSSLMHMAWVRSVAGRLKADYRYSKDVVYNNFPWPTDPSTEDKEAVETAAQKVLEVRARHADSELGILYNPETMPPELVDAHNALDRAVDHCYGKKSFKTEAERVEYLFKLYSELVLSVK